MSGRNYVGERATMFDSSKANAMVEELRGQFESGKTMSYEWRITQLENILRMLREKEEEIKEALRMDMGKHEYEAFISEISMLKSSCKFAIRKLKQWMKPKWAKPSVVSLPSLAKVVSEPLGVVLVISAWNYPFLLALDPLIGAISAGNCVVVKPSELAPASSTLITNLLHQYLDNECVKVVEGAAIVTGALLEQKWDKIFYTGSGRVGRIVLAAASKHLTPVALELGGKCPAVIDSNVNLTVCAKRIIAGKWGCNNGQTCVSPDYLITTKDFAPKLIEALRTELSKCFGQDPMQSESISRIVNTSHFSRLTKLLQEDGVRNKVVIGGQTDQKQLKIAPTVLLDVPTDSLIMTDEIFGPLLPIITVESLEEQSFNLIKSRPKPLAAYLFTTNNKLKKNFVNKISSGSICINDTVIQLTVPSLPFGGVGESGMGAYHGKFSFNEFSHRKAVLTKWLCLDVSVRYPPYTKTKLSKYKALSSSNCFHVIFGLIRVSKEALFH